MGTDLSDSTFTKSSLRNLIQRLGDNLHYMHDHLQALLEKKLGPDAQHVIEVERSRQTLAEKANLAENKSSNDIRVARNYFRTNTEQLPEHLSEVGNNFSDELELFNGYREYYALILADFHVMKEILGELEKSLQERGAWPFGNEPNDEIGS
jgi:hypothetical protein